MSATIHGDYRQCTTAEQTDALITEILTTLDGGDPWQDARWGETAALYFADQPLTAETFAEPPFTWKAIHELVISVNRATGFGTLRWDTEFVSSSPNPPQDPQVVGDPHVPYWYHPRYALPVSVLDGVIREFCRNEGAQPESITWSPDGSNHDRLYLSTDEYRGLSA